MQLTGKRVLIVGASSGIAAEAAVRLGAGGNVVGLVARRADKLALVADAVRVAGGEPHVWTADATDAEAMAVVVSEAAERLGGLDVVWVNAGQGPDLSMSSVSTEQIHDMTRLNYDVLVNALVPAIAVMRPAGRGHIVHTNSLAGLMAVPRQGPYGAAKAAAKHLMDTARAELEPEGLRFTSLFPGFVATERIAGDGLPKPFQISVATAAEAALSAIEAERRNASFPRSTATLVRGLGLLPASARNRVLRRLAR